MIKKVIKTVVAFLLATLVVSMIICTILLPEAVPFILAGLGSTATVYMVYMAYQVFKMILDGEFPDKENK